MLGCVYLSKLELLSFPDLWWGVGLLDHRVTLFLVFKGTAMLFATVAALRVHFVWSIHCVSFCYTLTWAFHVPFYNSFCTGFLNV